MIDTTTSEGYIGGGKFSVKEADMNLKRMFVGAGLIVWVVLAFRFIPQLWISIPGTYLILWFCSVAVIGFWSRTATKVFFAGWPLWWLTWWVFTPILTDPSAFWPWHLLGMSLAGVTTLVVWKMGESWHAKDYPKHFSQKYLNDLIDS